MNRLCAVYVLFGLVVVAKSAPTPLPSSLYEEIAAKCPQISRSEEFRNQPLLQNCKSWNSTIKIATFNDMTKKHLLCQLYYEAFTTSCTRTKEIIITPPVIYPIAEVCDKVAIVSDGILVNSDLKRLIKSEDDCMKLCTDFMGGLLQVCGVSYYLEKKFTYKAKAFAAVKPLKSNFSVPVHEISNNPDVKIGPTLSESSPSSPSSPGAVVDPEMPMSGEVPSKSVKSPSAFPMNRTATKISGQDQLITVKEEVKNEVKNIDPVEVPKPEVDKKTPSPAKIEKTEENSAPKLPETKSESSNLKNVEVDKPKSDDKVEPESNLPQPMAEFPEVDDQQSPDVEHEPPFPVEDPERRNEDYVDVDDPIPVVKDKLGVRPKVESSKPDKTDETDAVNAYTEMDGNSPFFSYFMFLCVLFVAGYVCYHNKQRLLALILEGRRNKRQYRSRRPNSANYHKLDSNLEEAISSNCSKNATNVIY